MQAYATGDARAFDALYRKHRPWLYRVILRQVGDAGRADEIFQEVWLSVTRRAGEWTPQAQVATWLYGIARSRIVDGWQYSDSVAAMEALPAGAAGRAVDNGDASAPDSTPADCLVAALDQLPPLHREAYLLAVEAGLSPGEVARATGSTLDGARNRVRSARAHLACALGTRLRAGRAS